MSFYFAWQKDHEPFCQDKHAREDLKVFSLVIEAHEGGFPLAKVRIQNRGKGLGAFLNQQSAYLSFQRENGSIELLFKGRLCQVPEKIDGESYEVHLTGEPADSDTHLQRLHQELKQTSLWDSLFVPEENHDDPKESLEARDSLFYWPRTGEPVALSHLFEGRHHLTVGENFLRDSLDMKMAELPLKGVRVRLKTSWQQSFRGRADLTYFLRSKFPGGLINTLSGNDLKAKWWKTGENLGQSGYWVEESSLEEISAPYTGVLGLYPGSSQKIWVSPHDPAAKKTQQPFQSKLKRFWYRASLILGWRYHQRRREVVELYLGHRVQPLGPDLHKIRTVSLTLHGVDLADTQQAWRPQVPYRQGHRVVQQDHIYQARQNHRARATFEEDRNFWESLGPKPDVPHAQSRSSFFTTERGHRCIAHALDIGKAHLAASSRAVEIRFSGAFESLSQVTCDHSITLTDDRLPGKKVTGKVKSYRLIAQGETGTFRADITLACAVGMPSLEHEEKDAASKDAQPYVSDTYCVEDLGGPSYLTSSQGIRYRSCYDQTPQQGLIEPQRLTAYDLVERVQISNGPETQNEYLKQNQYPERHNLQSTLNEVKTDIQVRLRDLRSKPALLHTIKVTVPEQWSAPCQINLSAN